VNGSQYEALFRLGANVHAQPGLVVRERRRGAKTLRLRRKRMFGFFADWIAVEVSTGREVMIPYWNTPAPPQWLVLRLEKKGSHLRRRCA